MHTTDTESTSFIHHGDYSGEIFFTTLRGTERTPLHAVPFAALAHAAAAQPEADSYEIEAIPCAGDRLTRDQRGPAHPVTIPGDDVRALLGHRIISERIAALEDMYGRDAFALGIADELPRWAAEAQS